MNYTPGKRSQLLPEGEFSGQRTPARPIKKQNVLTAQPIRKQEVPTAYKELPLNLPGRWFHMPLRALPRSSLYESPPSTFPIPGVMTSYCLCCHGFFWCFFFPILETLKKISSFSAFWPSFVAVHSLSPIRLFVTQWTAACQAPCPLLSPRICSDSCPLSQWCHPTVSSLVAPFSSCF